MSKKGKPTQAIMIEVSGNTVWAHVANAYGQRLECVAGSARCHPNDTFDFYEGARIALARAFGKNPFPKTADAEKPSRENPEEKTDVIYHPKLGFGRWVQAEDGKTGKPGDWILIGRPWMTEDLYESGDILKIHETEAAGCRVYFAKPGTYKFIANDEYSIWVPKDLSSTVPKKKNEETKPMEPSFQVGDIVRTDNSHPFVSSCRNCVAKVTAVRSSENCIIYTLSVRESTGVLAVQSCVQYRNRPAPLTLLWREEK